MNRNTRSRLNIARQNRRKGQNSTSFTIPKIISGIGERATWGNYGTRTFNFVTQARVSRRPKVAGGKGSITNKTEE